MAENYTRNPDGTLTPAVPLKGSWWVRIEIRVRRWLKSR